MNAFSPTPPPWTETATHALRFCCPRCHLDSRSSLAVWINRRAPVYGDNYRRKWQEFYHCSCGVAWWAWSCDRPPSPYGPNSDNTPSDNNPSDTSL